MPNISSYQNARRMLSRVPDAVILAVATQKMDMASGNACLVASVVKESLSALLDRRVSPTAHIGVVAHDAKLVKYSCSTAPEIAAKLYGGAQREWHTLFINAAESYAFPAVELAFVERVESAVKHSK